MTIETEQEADGRWMAEVTDLPGALAYGETHEEAIRSVKALALRVIADRLDHGEQVPQITELFRSADPVEQFHRQLGAMPSRDIDARREFCIRNLEEVATGRSRLLETDDRLQRLRLSAWIRCSLAELAFWQKASRREKPFQAARQQLSQAFEEAREARDSDAMFTALSDQGYIESFEWNTESAIEFTQRAAFYIDNRKLNRISSTVMRLALYWSEWPETLQLAEAMYDWLALIDHNNSIWARQSKFRANVRHRGPEEVREIAYDTKPATCADYELCIASRMALGHVKRAETVAAKALKFAEATEDKEWIPRFRRFLSNRASNAAQILNPELRASRYHTLQRVRLIRTSPIVSIVKNARRKVLQARLPDRPFVRAGRLLVDAGDALPAQPGPESARVRQEKVALADADVEQLQTRARQLRVGRHRRDVRLGREAAPKARAEHSHPGKCIQVAQPDRDRLESAHREARDCAAERIPAHVVAALDPGKEGAQQLVLEAPRPKPASRSRAVRHDDDERRALPAHHLAVERGPQAAAVDPVRVVSRFAVQQVEDGIRLAALRIVTRRRIDVEPPHALKHD